MAAKVFKNFIGGEWVPPVRGQYFDKVSPVNGKVVCTVARSTAEDVEKLRAVGWTEDQIAEAVYVIAMFAFFNRVADAFGVPPQNYLTIGKMTP